MGSHITYEAESLEDIAAEMGARARAERARANRAATPGEAALLTREAETWDKAAAMLRATTLKPKAD